MVADNKIKKCYTHIMEYTAAYASEGEARWEAELFRTDWENHWPDYKISLDIFENDNGEWSFTLTAKKKGCNLAEH